MCGSCWAFSAVAALEGAHFVHTLLAGKPELISLSEQQLVDCSTSFGNEGCNGGWMHQAFDYLKSTPIPLDTEAAYPYEGRDATCRASGKGPVSVSSFVEVPENSSAQLKAALLKGPVSVAIDAGSMAFQFYSGGVMDSAACGTELNHGVTAVGYGVEGGKEFYLVKNSWGSGWGAKGFIKVGIKDGPGFCGIQMKSSYPVTN